MKFNIRLLILAMYLSAFGCTLDPVFAANWPQGRPKLVVVIVLDQFRADTIARFSSSFTKDGFLALTKSGAYFPYGEYDIMQSMTAPGHATILTGSYPYQNGIPINEWFDQKSRAEMSSVDDESVQPKYSPRNFVGSTVGDELKNVNNPGKVVSLAIKPRAAILLGGKRADLAMWFDSKAKIWTTSTYYRKDGKAPEWLEQFNKKKAECEFDKPCSADATAKLFIAALNGEKMGRSAGPDLLAVSFSGHDITGHKFGPNSPELKAVTIAEDKAVAEMRAAVAKSVPGGLANVVFVLTGDHGVAPVPEEVPGLEAGRIDEKALVKKINESLSKIHGKPKKGEYVAYANDYNFYFDESVARDSDVEIAKLASDAKNILKQEPAFAHVFSVTDYEARRFPPGVFERRILKTYYPGRSGHVIALQKPFYINAGHHKANHMTGYSYDRMVPILLSGFGIKPGLYAEKAEVVDIAPTLTFLLGILPPALSEGRVLHEALLKAKAP